MRNILILLFIIIMGCAHSYKPFSGYNKEYFKEEVVCLQGYTTNIEEFIRDNHSPFLLVIEDKFTKINSDGTVVITVKGFYITRKEYFKNYNFKIR